MIAWGCGHSIDVSGAQSTPQPVGPEFVYVSNNADDVISVFSVDKKTGALTFVEQLQAAVGSGLKGITANRSFLFAADPTTSEVFGFKIDPKDGKLTPTAQGMFNTGVGTGPTALAISPGSHNLYVTDFANNQLFQLSFDTGTGALSTIGGGPVPTGKGPISVTGYAQQVAVFVANQTDGTISGFSRAKNGVLTPTGLIKSLGTSTGAPNFIAADISGAKLYSADSFGGPGGSAVVFTISGAMLQFVGAFQTGNSTNEPLSLTIDPDFPFVYAANDGNDNTSLYSITGAGLSAVSLIPGTPSVNSVVTDNLGTFLYETDNAITDGLVLEFLINTSTGALTAIDTIDTEVPANPASLPYQVISVQEPASS